MGSKKPNTLIGRFVNVTQRSKVAFRQNYHGNGRWADALLHGGDRIFRNVMVTTDNPALVAAAIEADAQNKHLTNIQMHKASREISGGNIMIHQVCFRNVHQDDAMTFHEYIKHQGVRELPFFHQDSCEINGAERYRYIVICATTLLSIRISCCRGRILAGFLLCLPTTERLVQQRAELVWRGMDWVFVNRHNWK